jgi:hypothetical protein
MRKLDPKKEIESYKARRGKFSVVDVPTLRYLMIDGEHGPDSDEFKGAIQTLYPVAYKLKFASKRSLGQDYVVPPLEGLWWAEDMSVFTSGYDKSQWLWTAMILTPDWITDAMFREALADVSAKADPQFLEKLRLEELSEGKCVQTLHIGSFADEGPVLETMHEQFIPENGFSMRGKHHEIYFSDFRKTPAEKLRTILRQPVA